MARKGIGAGRGRSAITGRFVTRRQVRRSPRTTIWERLTRRRRKST